MEDLREFVERFALVLADAGMPRMAARVFARILVEDEGRLTAAQLAERLGVSPAAVSGAVRYLTQTRLLRRERRPGQRVDHYALAEDTWYRVVLDRSALLDGWTTALDEGLRHVDERSPAAGRLRETRDFFAFLRTELPALMERWRAARDPG